MNTSNPSRTFSWNISASPQRHRACRNADRIAVACSMWGAFRMSAPLGVMLRGGESCVCIELTTGHGFLDVAIQKKTLPNCATAGFLADKGDWSLVLNGQEQCGCLRRLLEMVQCAITAA